MRGVPRAAGRRIFGGGGGFGVSGLPRRASASRSRTRAIRKVACAECHTEHRGRINLAATRESVLRTVPWRSFALQAEIRITRNTFVVLRTGIRSLRRCGHCRNSGELAIAATIKLNHALHMRAIRRGPTGPMVQLDCGNCHATGATNPDLTYSDAKYRATSVSYQDWRCRFAN